MLIEFSVTNFRSFNETQTFTMVKGQSDDALVKANTFTFKDVTLLRSAAIYGANASGKSNFLQAMQAMTFVVTESAKGKDGPIPVSPFRLNSKTIGQPSEFELLVVVDGIRYQYGFSATRDHIYEEWLIAYPNGRAQRWFDRSWNEETDSYDWKIGSKLSGEKQLWKRSTPNTRLFLSTAVQLNSVQLLPLFNWFKKTVRIAKRGTWGPEFSASLCEKEEKKDIIRFLREADIDVEDIFTESKRVNQDDLSNLPEAFKNFIIEHGDGILETKLIRIDNEGVSRIFDMDDDESDGTRKLFALAGPWMDVLRNGYVLFIDELHGNLHPRLVKFLVTMFHNPKTNPNNAQLIFTTHETSILHQEVFRRDQIWFCEKNKEKATLLFPLTDFKKPRNAKNLELEYLSGVYGAVPFVQSASL